MLSLLLAALKYAPAVFSAGASVFQAVTGDAPAADETPESLVKKVSDLPPDQQAEIVNRTLSAKVEIQVEDTKRFMAMNGGGTAAEIKATARPEIARRAMGVIETFAWVFKWLMIVTVVEWLARLGVTAVGKPFPDVSLWDLIARAAPVTELIWPPLLASFWVSAEVIKKYMGCRERDKAQEYEMMNGRPLSSAAATIQAAGGGIASLIKAIKG